MSRSLIHILRKNINYDWVRHFSSFTYLNVTQFLGALNDNIYKLLIVYFFIQLDGIEHSHIILSLTGAIFVLPFLLFSATSGILADRFSKRNIIVFTKLLELVIMTMGLFTFYYESRMGCYFVLFLMATQSTIFGPSKYGIVPELVSSSKISKANGLMTSFTFLAIILGTFLASLILDITYKNFILAASVCTIIALVGVLTSFCIEYTPPAGAEKKANLFFFKDIYSALKIAQQQPSLLTAILGSGFFLFLGAFFQLNMIPFAVQSLGLTDVQGGYLFLMTALGIGGGSMLAGKISGKTVELGIVPIAGIGMTFCCYMMDFFSGQLLLVVPLVILLGLLGGIFEVPLESYVQVASPCQYRGRIIAAANFLSFFGVLLASGLLYLISEVFGLKADKGFLIVGNITLLLTTVIGYQFFDYLSRFVGMVLSRLHFQITFWGTEKLPQESAIYICTHTAWNDTLLMLGTQRRRMRFFIEQEQGHTNKLMRRLYRLLRVVFIPDIEPLENNTACLVAIKKMLEKGISVCIFVQNPNVNEEIEKLQSSYPFREIVQEANSAMVPIFIEKGIKEKNPWFFTRLYAKFRVPAVVTVG